MSDTPRTDAKLVELKITEQPRHGHKLDKLAAYCRELEREISDMRGQVENAEAAYQAARDELRGISIL